MCTKLLYADFCDYSHNRAWQGRRILSGTYIQMTSFTIDVNIHAQTPIPFHRHMNFSSKNPGESFACLGSSDWTDPSPPFHPPTLLRGQPQVEQIQHCRKFQNLNKLSSFQQQWVRGTINRIRLPVLGIRSARLFLWCALRFLRNSAIQIGKGLS